MTSQSAIHPTLSSELWKSNSFQRNLVLVFVGVVLLTISAKAKIPFYPVPVTMQTFVVLCLGLVYGPALAIGSVLSYLLVGALGMPVFANPGAGIGYLVGPTGGFLIGFVIAAGITGRLAEMGWDRTWYTTFLAMLIGNIAIYIPGILWLGSFIGWEKPVLSIGLYPFVLGDLAKIVLAMVAIPAAWKAIKK